jgi:hypothetical protein
MRKILALITLAAFAAPAFAQTADTLTEITTKGIKMSAQGFELEVAYNSDGTFTAMEGQVTGKWRIEGDKLCTQSNFDAEEECVLYPAGKKSGDSFDVTGKAGTATITIK